MINNEKTTTYITLIGFGQDTSEFSLTKEGLKTVNIQISNIHSKVINWVNNTYLSAEKVIIANTNAVIVEKYLIIE